MTVRPVVIKRGEEIYVFDDQGNRYIEGLSGLFCASLCFSEERLVEAALRQMCASCPFIIRSAASAINRSASSTLGSFVLPNAAG